MTQIQTFFTGKTQFRKQHTKKINEEKIRTTYSSVCFIKPTLSGRSTIDTRNRQPTHILPLAIEQRTPLVNGLIVESKSFDSVQFVLFNFQFHCRQFGRLLNSSLNTYSLLYISTYMLPPHQTMSLTIYRLFLL